MIAKSTGAAVVMAGVLTCLGFGAGSASAEPLPPEPNPFGGLTCDCQLSPVETPNQMTELQRGLQVPRGLADHHRHSRSSTQSA